MSIIRPDKGIYAEIDYFQQKKCFQNNQVKLKGLSQAQLTLNDPISVIYLETSLLMTI